MKKAQRKAMLTRRKWRRVREKRIRAKVKLWLKGGAGGHPTD